MIHIPVLLKEVVAFLKPAAGKKFIDATFGEGGHAKALVSGGAEVLGIDIDSRASKKAKILDSRFKMVEGNFTKLQKIAKDNGFEAVDGTLFDLGLGSHQLDDEARGFSFQKEGPLDMRFAEGGLTAGEIISHYPEKALVRIFYDFGEERRFGKRVARAIVTARKSKKRLKTTLELFELIKKALPASFRKFAGDTARRIFQSLRIAVNHELENLVLALPQALKLLKAGGRLAVISFHSLEDRIVKRFFLENSRDCTCPPSFPICICQGQAKLRILTKKPLRPGIQERQTNPRSHSAKLRVAEKIWDDTLP